MTIGHGRALLLAALFAAGGAAAGCHSKEPVIPFMDSGDPCSGSSTSHSLDCAEFADTTCVVQGSVCPLETYGCADAAYFTKDDYSQCPPEGGGLDAAPFDGSLLGDGSILNDDASDGGSSDASDSSDSSDSSEASEASPDD
ncbi:MAG TPA: hypothetical protein VGL81_12145 [Polyangiaceae bacterium]